MLSSVLRSERAVKANIEIMRAFGRLRRLLLPLGRLSVQRANVSLYCRQNGFLCQLQIISTLKVYPKFGGSAEVNSKSKGSVRCYRTPTFNNIVNSADGDVQIASELVLAKLKRGHKFLGQDLTRRNGSKLS